MKLKRRTANFFIKGCGLRKLHDSKLQRFIRAVLDEIDLQHVRDTYPCRPFRDRKEMYQYTHEVCINGEAVDYLEFGVYQGDSMREWVSLNKHKDSRFFGFDSFEGLPEDWCAERGKGHFGVGGAVPSIDDPRVKFVKGWFNDTIPSFVRDFSVKNRLVLHFDADLYCSTMLPLVHLDPFISNGTLLIFDEFYDRNHEFKALTDWQRIHGRKFRIVAEMQNYSKICAELV